MKVEIKHRFTGAVLFATEVDDGDRYPIRTALKLAVEAHADLAGADLAGADLAGAYLADAYLADADLARARNVPRSSPQGDPPTPYKRATTPEERKARQAERAKWYREKHPEVPVVEHLDRKILDAIADGGVLDMGSWHGDSCGTTHCRAGWAIHLAGKAGYELEKKTDSQRAGAMIYRASTGRVPHFFASNQAALDDLKRCAAEVES